MNFRKLIPRLALGGAALLVAAQLVPYGRDHQNPPVKREPKWISTEARDIAHRACFDCHSNETHWPWYSNVAPMSWLVYRDTLVGRKKVNFSDWDAANPGSESLTEEVERGDMPFKPYLAIHWNAWLTKTDKETLLKALKAIEDSADE
jgi:hypothetical protein